MNTVPVGQSVVDRLVALRSEVDVLRIMAAQDQARIDTYRALLRRFIDDEPCARDHEGWCRTHDIEEPCPMDEARAALAESEETPTP